MAYHDDAFNKFLEVGKITRKRRRPQAWLAISYLLVIGLLFGSWGTAYAAMDSLPNDPLYSVKLMGEDLQLLLTSDTTARISLLTIYANRRADEATILAWQGEPIPEKLTTLIGEYQEELVALSAIVDEDPDPVVGIHMRPQDQDRGGEQAGEDSSDHNDTPPRYSNNERQPGDEQTAMIMEMDAADLTTTITGTLEISGTMNMTPTRLGESYGPGSCVTPGDCATEDEHSPGPYYEEHSTSPYYGTPPGSFGHEGYSPESDQGLGLQQPPTKSPPDVIEKSKPADNKGK